MLLSFKQGEVLGRAQVAPSAAAQANPLLLAIEQDLIARGVVQMDSTTGQINIVGGIAPDPAVLFAITMMNREITMERVEQLEAETGKTREELLAQGFLGVENASYSFSEPINIDTESFRDIAKALGRSIQDLLANPLV